MTARKPTSRPWGVPPPWPVVKLSTPPSHAELGRLVTQARERHERRIHGAA